MICCKQQGGDYLHVKCIINFAPDGHGTKFSCVGGGGYNQ